MDLNINVNGTVKVVLDTAFDVEKLAAVLAGSLAAPAEKSAEEKPGKKQRQAAKANNAEPAESVTATKAEPAAPEPVAEPAPAKEPLSEEKVTALRKSVAAFIHADEGNKTKVKDWLTVHGIRRVPDITKDLLAEFNAFVGAE